MEYTFKDIMEIIANFVAIGGFLFAGIQLWQIKSNRKKQYEQARREKTAEMIMYYAQRVNPKTKYIEKLLQILARNNVKIYMTAFHLMLTKKSRINFAVFVHTKKNVNLRARKYVLIVKENVLLKTNCCIV